jgi:hypothetical protein
VHLTTPERRVFEEALRLGADLADEVESKVSAYGRWLLGEIFNNDSTAALDTKTKNPVWLELVRRAGGPTLRVSRRMLYIALELAARDQRIADQAWRGLDAGRKELLLPLDDDRRLREAAQHVSQFNLTQTKTREYVTALMVQGGKKSQSRFSARVLRSRVTKLREGLDGASVLRRVTELGSTMDPRERQKLTAEIDALREVLLAITKRLRTR